MERVLGATAASGVPRKPHRHRHLSLVAPSVTVQPPLDSRPKFSRRGSWTGRSNSLTVRRRMSNDAVGHGLFGSFRRLSLDQSQALQEELANDNTISPSFSINEYQEAFQQMKQENPTTSMGALKQKTMTKITELNVAKEQEAAHERNIQQRKNEEERLRNRPPSKKCVDRWVGNMRYNSEHQENRRKSDPEYNSNSHEWESLGDKFAHLITPNTANSRRPFKMMRRNSADLVVISRRRSSMDSTAGTETTLSTEDVLYINAGLVPGGDDQGDNFALRRSIGSETANSNNVDASAVRDDESVQSFLSEGTDGLFDCTRSSFSRNELCGLRSWLGDTIDSAKSVVDDVSVGIDEEIWNKSFEKKNCIITDEFISVGEPSIEILNTRTIFQGLHDDRSTYRSDASDCSTYYSGASSSNGLIVDFTDRSDLRGGLIVGFGQRSRLLAKRVA